MRNLILVFLLVFTASLSANIVILEPIHVPVTAENFDLSGRTKVMSDEEREALELELKEKMAAPGFMPPIVSAPPGGVLRPSAQFCRNDAVMIVWPGRLPMHFIADLTHHTTLIIATMTSQATVINTLAGAGANTNNIMFFSNNVSSESAWPRDFGPFFSWSNNGELLLIDYQFRGGLRNAFNAQFVNWLDLPYHHGGFGNEGGNHMTDGIGIAASVDRAIQWNSAFGGEGPLRESYLNFLGVHTFHLIPSAIRPPFGIDHIDCFAKFLTPDMVTVTSRNPGHQNYVQLENAAAFFASQTTSWGTTFQVVRLHAPNNEPYANKLIFNDRIYLPIVHGSGNNTGWYSPGPFNYMNSQEWDDLAMETLEDAMPGYTIVGVTNTVGGISSPLNWLPDDALHCRVREIPARHIVNIMHTPVAKDLDAPGGVLISANIRSFTPNALDLNSVVVRYRVGLTDEFQSVVMTPVGNNNFETTLFVHGLLSYYIEASDVTGITDRHPFIGAPMAHRSQVFGDINFPVPPTGLSATHTATSVTLTWNAPDAIPGSQLVLQGYRVYRNGTAISGTVAALTFTDTNVSSPSVNNYAVRAIYSTVESALSNVLTVQMLGTPGNFVATHTGQSVRLTWTAPPMGAGGGVLQGYRVYRNDVAITGVINALTYTDTNIANMNIYTYQLVAVYNIGISGRITQTVSVLFPVYNLTGVVFGNQVTLNWEPPTGTPAHAIAGYRVYRNGHLLTPNYLTGFTFTENEAPNENFVYSVLVAYNDFGYAQADLSVNLANPIIVAAPTSIDFGNVPMGTPVQRAMTVTNRSGASLIISSVGFADDEDEEFTATHANLPITLANNANTALNITFDPASEGEKSALIAVGTSSITYLYQLTGVGVGPSLVVEPGSIEFEVISVGETSDAKTVTISSNNTVVVNAIGFKAGGDGGMFVLNNTHTMPVTVQAGQPITVSVAFKPTQMGAFNATLYVTDESDNSYEVGLEGKGILLRTPTELTATIEYPDVNLTWLAPSLEGMADLFGPDVFKGFRLYRDDELLHSTADLAYLDTNVVENIEYTYFVTAVYAVDGKEFESAASNKVTVTVDPRHLDDITVDIRVTELVGNFPNPFNPDTAIRFNISNDVAGAGNAVPVLIQIYNIRGQSIRTLVDNNFPAGEHSVTWNGRDDLGNSVGSGVYLYRMRAGDVVSTRRMMLMK